MVPASFSWHDVDTWSTVAELRGGRLADDVATLNYSTLFIHRPRQVPTDATLWSDLTTSSLSKVITSRSLPTAVTHHWSSISSTTCPTGDGRTRYECCAARPPQYPAMTGLPLRPIAELTAAVSGHGRSVVVLTGAGISMPEPSRLPGAWAWKTELLKALAARSDLGFDGLGRSDLRQHLDDLAHLGETTDIKLEATLQAIDDAQPALAQQLVECVIHGVPPNAIHEYLARAVISGAVRTVVTPNFDELIEDAAAVYGSPLTQWVTGEPPRLAHVLHVHGTATAVRSLRHTLNRFELRLPTDEHRLVADVLRDEVVALGWSATDPDILSALAEGSGPVRVLLAGHDPAPETAQTLEALARRRPVILYPGGFDAAFGRQRWPSHSREQDVTPSGVTPTQSVIDRLSVPHARTAIAHLSFRHQLRAPQDQVVLDAWASRIRRDDPHDVLAFRRAMVEQRQASRKVLNAALIQAAICIMTADPHDLSTLGDVIERIGGGLNPFKRVIGLPFHVTAVMLMARRGRVDPFARARLARALDGLGLVRPAKVQLQRAFASLDADASDIWVRGHLHRLLAAVKVRLDSTCDWQSDIATALELFRFDNRSLEMGNVYRTEAMCHVVSGRLGWRADAAHSLAMAEHHYRIAADASAFGLLRLQRRIIRLPLALARLVSRLA
ncbi:hypothetical protein JDM601_4303 [Mycolicibacter sinensis]|uniref:SIR2-like domain-containing protein n=1 Tax=Mycolicibacter sinensis (strain JDM601) TaxID=875328 RepID=F5YVP6_MYCSD|nr:hypothetical protein JDM601_4303 [Mycolicibacter sinensis]